MMQVISKLLRWGPNGRPPVDLEHLTRLLRRYSVEQQQVPKELGELVALNYLEAIPPAPPGRKFVVDRKRVEVRLEEMG
jgi:hypothetical protein